MMYKLVILAVLIQLSLAVMTDEEMHNSISNFGVFKNTDIGGMLDNMEDFADFVNDIDGVGNVGIDVAIDMDSDPIGPDLAMTQKHP